MNSISTYMDPPRPSLSFLTKGLQPSIDRKSRKTFHCLPQQYSACGVKVQLFTTNPIVSHVTQRVPLPSQFQPHHFYTEEKRSYEKCDAIAIEICHCLLARVFFNPLSIFPNHIKFIAASTAGTTKTKKKPNTCIWIT